MKTLNERMREVRQRNKLSQKDFAERIGISQRAVSWGEQPGNNVPDNTIKNICMAFGISEPWLRDGIEPMYIQPPEFSLDDFIKRNSATDLEIDILKAYFELDPELRNGLIDHFKGRLLPHLGTFHADDNDLFKDVPDDPKELERMFPPVDPPADFHVKKNKIG